MLLNRRVSMLVCDLNMRAAIHMQTIKFDSCRNFRI